MLFTLFYLASDIFLCFLFWTFFLSLLFPLFFSFFLFLLLGCGICMVHIGLLRHNILITLVHLFLLAFRPCLCCVTDYHAIARDMVPVQSWQQGHGLRLRVSMLLASCTPAVTLHTFDWIWHLPLHFSFDKMVPAMNGGQQELLTDQHLIGKIFGGVDILERGELIIT